MTVLNDSSYVAVVRALSDQLAAEVSASHRQRNLTDTTVELLHSSGLFRMRVPVELGGGSCDATEAFEVVESLSAIDGALGWTYMAGANLLGVASAYLADDAVQEVLADECACIAGQIAPRGTAVAVDGGYVVTGDFGFSSGSNHSTYILGGYREVAADGQPVRLPTGTPNVIAALVPADRIEFDSSWDVLGLEATGSVDYHVPEQFVDARFTWPLFTAEPRRRSGVHVMGILGATSIDHSAFSIGVASRAIQEITNIAQRKKRPGRPLLIEDPVFQRDLAAATASVAAARAYAVDALTALEASGQRGSLSLDRRAEARLATTHAAHACIDAAAFAHAYSGSTGLRCGSVVQQCFRDLAATEAHVFTDHNSWQDVAKALVGLSPETVFL